MKFSFVILLFSLLVQAQLYAKVIYQSNDRDNKQEVAFVELIENSEAVLGLRAENGDELGDIVKVIDQLIAVGKKVWQIVEDGKPVYSKDLPLLHILPNVDGNYVSFYQMDSWSAPTAKSYTLIYKNGFGQEVINFKFTVIFQHGGKYNDLGSYLSGITVVPNTAEVMWGFKFDVKSQVLNIANVGTKDGPIASTIIKVDFKAESPLKLIDSSMSFFISGAGELQLL